MGGFFRAPLQFFGGLQNVHFLRAHFPLLGAAGFRFFERADFTFSERGILEGLIKR